ncbi:MAG: RDD family protein [Planctomycetaceae bacterium]
MSANAQVHVVPQEARPYQGRRAGIVTRVLANAIDVAVVVAAVFACYLGWAAILFLVRRRDFHFPTATFGALFTLGITIWVVYLAVAWASTGRTYGDQVLGLRVVNHEGRRMRFVGALVRAVFCAAFPIGLGWAALSKENRSIQDLVLRTSVIYDWESRPRPDAPA